MNAPARAWRTVRAVGTALVAAGVLLLLFVSYQLWGTGLRTAQAQVRLEDDLRRAIADTSARPRPVASESIGGPAPPLRPEDLPSAGQAAGRIEIPAIELDWVFVQGVSVADLKKGPGHYPQTPLPGQAGNAAIAGHRTTYGAPFNRIDQVEPGDEIIVTTAQGRFRYRMSEQSIVDPSQTEVLDPIEDRSTLTLTSCHPKYSARQRIIVRADLAGDPLPTVLPTSTGARRSANDARYTLDPGLDGASLSGDQVGRMPMVVSAAIAGAVWLAAALLARRWRRWPAYAIGLSPFLVALFLFFEQVSLLLPANY